MRVREGVGTAQLVLLGRWLQQRGYSFWSLGHCYSPEMDYKRQLGHRIYPRDDFIQLLREHRGTFKQSPARADREDGGSFRPLGNGREECPAALLLSLVKSA